MRALLLIVPLLTMAAPAYAQQQQSPMEQALSQKLLTEINASLQCSAAQVTLQARVKALEDKYEPKQEPPK